MASYASRVLRVQVPLDERHDPTGFVMGVASDRIAGTWDIYVGDRPPGRDPLRT